MRTLTALVLAAAAFTARPAAAVDLHYTGYAGYHFGTGVRAEAMARDLLRNVPLGLSLGVGYTLLDPGSPARARQVFINDATDGTPEKHGHFWDVRLDAIWFLRVKHLQSFGVFGGVRHDWFEGRFRFHGGNEDFTVTAHDWGVGLGARGEVPLSRRWALTFSGGLDWYPESTLYGHDTTYSSDGGSTNGRAGYGWGDADRAVNQPRLVPSLLVGITFR